jgi:DNA gyrase subunit A
MPESMEFLVRGYIDYAKEVVISRAIPGIDGFKPVHRRILWSMKEKELTHTKSFSKSAKVVGDTMPRHPHGDKSIYDTLARLTDARGGQNVAFIEGHGNFGKAYSGDNASAMRYTGCRLSEYAELLFGEMGGVRFIPVEDGSINEPELLPVAFPNILVNPNSGIAVGLASNIPAFNFNDVNNAVIELIEKGDVINLLAPDSTAGGYYVNDPHELRRFIKHGKAKMRFRGKWVIEGKEIIITELPPDVTTITLEKEIKKLKEKDGIPGMSDYRDETELSGLRYVVECSSKKHVDSVLTTLLRDTSLQVSMTTNLTVIIGGVPRVLGVKDLLLEWIDFRSGVLKVSLENRLEIVKRDIPRYELFVDLMTNEEKRRGYMDSLVHGGYAKASLYLRGLYPEADEEIFKWIYGMKFSSLDNIASKDSKLGKLRLEKSEIETDLRNIRGVIVRELKDLNVKYRFPRKTEITEQDYVFEKEEKVTVKAAPTKCIVQVKGKFVKKLADNRITEDLPGTRCMSDDVLSFMDDRGRLLRLVVDSIPFCSASDRGGYLPVLLGLPDDFNVVGYELIADKTVGYIYSDGFASVVDYGEWANGSRVTKKTDNGVSPYSNLIIADTDLSTGFLLLIASSGRFGFVGTDFKRKNRTARTKLVTVRDDDKIARVIPLNYGDMQKLVKNPMSYVNALKFPAPEDNFDLDYLRTL